MRGLIEQGRKKYAALLRHHACHAAGLLQTSAIKPLALAAELQFLAKSKALLAVGQ